MGRKQVLKRKYDSEGKLISKECSKCHEIKPVSEFSKNNGATDGLKSKCRECIKKHYQENKDKFKEIHRKYYQENKDKISEKHREYYQENKDKSKEKHREYYQENKDKINEKHKKRYQENKNKINEKNREYYQENKDKFKEKHRKYREENKDKISERHRKYREENKDKVSKRRKQYNDKKIQEALQQIKIEVESDPEKYNYIEGKEIYGIIYLVHNINSNKYYVGQTIVGFDNRYSSGWLYDHKHKNTVKHDLELYGENSFKYIKLFKVAHSQYELDKLEAYYIDYYNSYENGYNENRGNIFTDRGKEK